MTHDNQAEPHAANENGDTASVTPEHLDQRRMVEAVLFAADRPLSLEDIAARLPDGVAVADHVDVLRQDYTNRGVVLEQVAGKWQFRTAQDLSFLLRREVEETRRLSRAAVETLAIIAYHQPVTRADIEEIRGVGLSKGTLDVLMQAGWIRPRGRRKTPGRPLMYGTSEDFLVHFGLETINDLPGINELQATGMLDSVDETMEKLAEAQRRAAEDEKQIDLEDAIEASLARLDDEDLEEAIEEFADDESDDDATEDTV